MIYMVCHQLWRVKFTCMRKGGGWVGSRMMNVDEGGGGGEGVSGYSPKMKMSFMNSPF